MPETKIDVRGLCKVFGSLEKPGGGTEVLKDINFEIGEGEILCLLGPSGCGKTTVLNIIAGFQKPTKGEVWVNGKFVDRPGGYLSGAVQRGSPRAAPLGRDHYT